MKDEIKVGFFVLAGIIVLGFSLFMLGDFSFEKRYLIYVAFDDVGGLANKSAVKLNGVEIGKIKDIKFKDSKVIAEILVKESVKIPRDSKFYIGSTSIIGSKFIQIERGKNESGMLEPQETVMAFSRKPLDEMITEVAENVNKLIKNLDSNGEFTKNLNDVVKNLRDITANLNDVIAANSPKLEGFSQKLDETMDNIKNLTSRLNSIVSKIDNGEGTIGTLLSDPGTKDDVKQSITNIKEATKSLKDFVGKTSKIKTYWKWDFKYENSSGQSFNDVGLKINVNDNKYYYVGASNIINIKNKPFGVSYEEPNTIDAYIGWGYPLWEFYIGAIRSTGGFGLRYTPFYYDDVLKSISVVAEANEFSRNRSIKDRFFNDARYDIGLLYKLSDKFSAGIKITDILEVKRVNVSTRVLFEDKDIANLLGLVGGGGTAALVK
ncbi:MAG: MCE family protein [Elusimicrobiota bacterium]